MSDMITLGMGLKMLSPEIRGRVNANLGAGSLASYDQDTRNELAAAAAIACSTRFPRRYQNCTMADLDQPGIVEWADQFTASPRDAQSMLLTGQVGTGKTHAAYAAIRHIATRPLRNRAGIWRTPSWRALTHADLLASLRPRASKDDPEAILTRYQTVDLLFIDDLGAIKATEYVEETTYRLLNARYEAMLPCIVTSNLSGTELRDAIGARIFSRLAEDCKAVHLTGTDRRRTGRAA